jgi:glycine/D-amino acid oxidase-like deaminating enzyme
LKEIAVIGGGITGLACARRLAQSGNHVSLFYNDSSASLAAPGINSLKGIFLGNSSLFRQKISGHSRLWKELVALEKETSMELGLSKLVLEPFSNQKELSEFMDRAYHGRFLGLFGTKIIPRDLRFTGLNEQFIGALAHNEDYSFDPVKALKSLERSFLSLQGKMLKRKVEKISGQDRTFCLHFENGDVLHFDDVVLAAGAASPQILKNSGIWVDGFKWKAGVSLVAESKLHLTLKRQQKSLSSQGQILRFGSQDFSVFKYFDFASFKQENLKMISDAKEATVKSLRMFTDSFANLDFLLGVRLNGPGNAPLVKRLEVSHGKAPVIATGFHRSGWSLAWEASDKVADLVVQD